MTAQLYTQPFKPQYADVPLPQGEYVEILQDIKKMC